MSSGFQCQLAASAKFANAALGQLPGFVRCLPNSLLNVQDFQCRQQLQPQLLY